MRVRLVPMGILALWSLACGTPKAGEPCDSKDWKCASTLQALVCVNKVWTAVPCGGPLGCVSSGVPTCDTSVSANGTPCPPWADGTQTCQGFPPALLRCNGGLWSTSQTCASCTNGNCVPDQTGGGTGGGVAGGTGGGTGGGTAGGTGGGSGGGSAGGSAGGSGGGVAGGTGGGTPACSPANCTGCCASNGQCMTAPLNQTPDFCGTSGNACLNCRTNGQVCNSSFMCVVSTGGGSAGGTGGGGSTGCSTANCATGCCKNGQCFAPPLNTTLNFCGTNANGCQDCGALGLVCNPASFSCTTTGGGAGGGTAGGTAGGSGGGTAGGSAGGTGGGGADPCNGVPTSGHCLTSTVVEYCSIPTGTGTPSLQTYACPGGMTCQATGAGAACVSSGSCVYGDTRCVNATTLEACTQQGAWAAPQTCTGGTCRDSVVGGYCAPNATTTTLTGTLQYQTHDPLTNYSGWTGVVTAPGRNVLVISLTGTNGDWLDATTTDATGHFSIRVPTAPTSNDKVAFFASGGNNLNFTYSVLATGFGAGNYSIGQTPTNPRYWSWANLVSSMSNGGTTTITEAQNSQVLNIFDQLQYIYPRAKTLAHGEVGLPIAMWFDLNVNWSCGACFLAQPGAGFDSQIFVSGSGMGMWSDAVMSHELGHWQMASYGQSPGEGGAHYLGVPTFPGQAWSEGWATWHSAAARAVPVYFDDQGGGMFWLDISQRLYDGTTAFVRPTPAGGILQRMDENEVSAELWRISSASAGGVQLIHNAEMSAHMTTSPWPRGYTRHTWSVDASGNIVNPVDTGQASLMIADAFDALRCGGLPAATVDSATNPSTAYPYPSTSPICRSGYCYGCRPNGTGTCQPGTSASACGTGGTACQACSGSQNCIQGVCQ